MSPLSARITRVERSNLRSRYPRTVGRNARLGSHGAGPESQIVILHTDSGRIGWGLVAGTLPPEEQVIGHAVEELFDPAVGVLDPRMLGLDFALHDLAGHLLQLPVHHMLGSRGKTSLPVYDGAIYFDDLDPEESPRASPHRWRTVPPTMRSASGRSSSRSVAATDGWTGPPGTPVTSR